MADDLDRAEKHIELQLAAHLRKRRPVGPPATGVCLWCEAVLPNGWRWCDHECESDWEYDQVRRRANGDA